MRLRGTVFAALAALTLAAASWAQAPGGSPMGTERAQAQSPQGQSPPGSTPSYQGLRVQSITFPGVPGGDQQQLRQLIPQKSSAPLDRDQIRQSIQILHATGRFADIRADAEHTADGQVAVAFVTQPNYFVGLISAEGTRGRPTENQVVNASKLQLGELLTKDKIERALKNIKQLMEENGYHQTTVSEEEQKHPDTQQVDILFRLALGPQAQVGRVTVTGTPGYSEGTIQDIAKMHPGDLVSRERVTRALERLRKKYQKQNRLLAQVSIAQRAYRPEVNAVDYTFDIEPGPRVDITTEGFKVSRGVLKRNVPVYEENAFDDDLINEGRRNLLNYLQSRGYFAATVGLKKSADPAGKELRVVYVIDAGERHKLLKVEITGNQIFPEDLLRSRMQVQPAGRFLSHGTYSQGLLSDDIRNLEDDPYRANGFQEIKITPKVEDNYQGRKDHLVVALQIEEGPQTLVGTRQLVGNQSVSEDELRDRLSIEPGQGFSEAKIAQDREIILNYYFNHGFPDATFEASVKPTPGESNSIDVTYTIHEGEQVFIDHVFVAGLNYTRPVVVQRELQVQPGDSLSQIAMLRTQQSLYNLGIFNQADATVQNPEGVEPKKNVLVAVQEAKRYTFNYGLGLEFQTGQPTAGAQGETGVSPRVSFDVTRLNFRGRNHTITFKSHVGRLQQRALVSYSAPRWFNSPDWKLSFTTFYDNTLDVTTFTSQRLEASIQAEQVISRRPKPNDSPVSLMNYRFTYRRVQATNLVISKNQIPLLSQPVIVGMPGFSYIRDKRDNPIESMNGNYTTVDGGVASKYFGSETDFSRILIQNSTYQAFGKNPKRRFVFARSTRIGIETPFANTIYLQPGQGLSKDSPLIPMPLPELFLAGGGNSHRGFGLNQAGPRDPVTGFPVGGSALFLNNLELRFPPVTLPFFQDNVSFTIFHDAGNVFTTGHDMFHNLLRWRQKSPQLCRDENTASQCDYAYISHAIGVGVNYKTPIGPVRFDFGYNLNPPAFPSCQSRPGNLAGSLCPVDTQFEPQLGRHFNVYFSIGQTF